MFCRFASRVLREKAVLRIIYVRGLAVLSWFKNRKPSVMVGGFTHCKFSASRCSACELQPGF